MIEKAFLAWLAVSLGNFIYQVFTQKNWKIAFERSFFQAIGIAALVLNLQ